MASILELAKTTLGQAGDVNATPVFLDAPSVVYEEASATSGMSSIPRFGHTNNFSALFIDDESAEDYLRGLIFVGAFILAIFSVWCLTLLVLKICGDCCCSYRFPGFLSGRPFTMDDDEPTKYKLNRWRTRSNRYRVAFIFCGISLIVAAIMMNVPGVEQVKQTRLVADKSLDNARSLVYDAALLAEDLRDVGLSAVDLRDQLVVELDKDSLCPNDPNYLAQDEITRAIQDNAGTAIDMLEVLGEFATKDLKQMESGLEVAIDIIDEFDVLVQNVEQREGVGLAFTIPLIILAVVMIVGAVIALRGTQRGCFEFILSWVFLPLFIVWIVASFILCGLIALAASANADFCAGGMDMTPDSTILLALQNAGMNVTSIEYEIARYYVHQCTEEAKVDPYLFLRQHQGELLNAQDVVQELATSLEKIDIQTLGFECGRDFEPLSSSLDTMMAILDRLDEAATSGLKLLSCERIVPIYTDVVYSGTCNHSVKGVTWIFASLLVIATMGMLMITFRSSFLNNAILVDMDPTDDDSEYGVMAKALERAENEAKAADPDSQVAVHTHWQHEAAARQDTSDSGSVYTDGGELNVYKRNESLEIAPSDSHSPKLYELEENIYDSRGKVIASAPYEHELGDYGYSSDPNYKSRVY